MNFTLNPKIWPYFFVILSVLILIIAFVAGISRGTTQAQAQATYEEAKQIKQGMDYFYSDNNRYPTSAEFADPGVMGSYFKNYPPQPVNSSACPQSFVYKQLSAASYQLNFCLETGLNGFAKGWNAVVENHN